MLRPKILLLFFLAILSIAWFSSAGVWKKNKTVLVKNKAIANETSNPILIKLKQKAIDAEKFAVSKGFNPEICFLVDMSLPSGQSRFYVFDMKGDSVRRSGLVTHGRCNENWLEGRKYGNIPGCGCTSLGKYRIGYKYQGRFGLAYKLHGLEKTNDQAFARFVVLHSHACVPASEVVDEICQSDGCPTVAPDFLQGLATIINNSKKPILLWIYD